MKKVVKFGGSSLASAEQFEKVGEIVRSDNARMYVVPSAPGKRYNSDTKVTDMLYACYDLAKKDKDFSRQLKAIKGRYDEIITGLKLKMSLDSEFEIIEQNFKAKAGSDYAASRGEYLNGRIMSEYLKYEFIDAAEVIFFDENGDFDSEKTNKVLGERLYGMKNAVVPGFYGSMPDGSVKTFSRGGSDITGSIVSRAAKVDIYENWTDVSGFLVADPRIIDDPAGIDTITYRELRELSYMGASVLHEDAVFPARMAGIPINIRNTNAPDDPGTVISREGGEDGEYIISGIAGKPDFTVISIYKNMMNKEIGFVRRALAIIEDQRINFDHIPTGIDSLSMVIESKELEDKLDDVLDAFRQQLKPDEIIVEDKIALIAVVGRRMHRSIGVSARICTALADNGINIKMLNQGTNEINVIVGVEACDFEEAVRVLYAEFVR